MSQGEVSAVFKDAIITALLMAGPFLIASVVIGIVISVIQAATQIHEQNIGFVFKIVAIGLLLVLLFSWLITIIMDFTNRTFESILNFL